MTTEKQKDFRIAKINLLSNGFVCVQDKDDNLIDDLSDGWSEEYESNLREIAPKGIKFGSWSVLDYAKEVMEKHGRPERTRQD